MTVFLLTMLLGFFPSNSVCWLSKHFDDTLRIRQFRTNGGGEDPSVSIVGERLSEPNVKKHVVAALVPSGPLMVRDPL